MAGSRLKMRRRIAKSIRELLTRRKPIYARNNAINQGIRTMENLSMTKNKNSANDIFLGANDVAELFLSQLLKTRFEQKIETFHDKLDLHSTRKQWYKYLDEVVYLSRFQFQNGSGYFFDDARLNYVYYSIHSTHVSVELIGDEDFIREFKELLNMDFDLVTNQIEWMYSTDGSSVEVPLQPDRMPLDEMYPFLGDTKLSEYYDNFMKSNASILLLIGPPGTGKTTFIRGLLQHTSSSAIVTYDATILEKDYVFANFIEGEKSVMVMEDADTFLKSRKEGGTMMHKFLNVGDGLVTTRGKKIIFSTNLPSIKDIDPALVRPGRCYDVVTFDMLTQEQAEILAKKADIELVEKRSKWTIAEVFNQFSSSSKKIHNIDRKLGFV
jgi:energy-coupling factor transporter ATP-binding protein EcfA2